MNIVIITGMSGAGKTQAIGCLEDQGYYCIDNMPPALIKSFVNLSQAQGGSINKAAFVVDIRGAGFSTDLRRTLEELAEFGASFKVVFLEAENSVLIRRFNETRRNHPMSKSSPTVEDIEAERKSLSDIRAMSDFIIDTSNMKTANLKTELVSILQDENREEAFVINIMSFGFKNGIPISADMVFDMRFIPNPFYLKSLKRATGNNKKVQQYVMKHIEAQMFEKNLAKLINGIIPCYYREGKFHLNLAFGCTGGQHRSVVMANEFDKLFRRQGYQVTLEHRDLKKK